MTTSKGEVIHLHERDQQAALQRLNRITGLSFARWPESLVRAVEVEAPPAPQEPAGPMARLDAQSG
jgi:hypothetical protein